MCSSSCCVLCSILIVSYWKSKNILIGFSLEESGRREWVEIFQHFPRVKSWRTRVENSEKSVGVEIWKRWNILLLWGRAEETANENGNLNRQDDSSQFCRIYVLVELMRFCFVKFFFVLLLAPQKILMLVSLLNSMFLRKIYTQHTMMKAKNRFSSRLKL